MGAVLAAAAERARGGAGAAARIVPLRRLHRRLPGQDPAARAAARAARGPRRHGSRAPRRAARVRAVVVRLVAAVALPAVDPAARCSASASARLRRARAGSGPAAVRCRDWRGAATATAGRERPRRALRRSGRRLSGAHVHRGSAPDGLGDDAGVSRALYGARRHRVGRARGRTRRAARPDRSCREVHVTELREADIVPGLAELFAALGPDLPSALAIVTGPSRSADIEQTLTSASTGRARCTSSCSPARSRLGRLDRVRRARRLRDRHRLWLRVVRWAGRLRWLGLRRSRHGGHAFRLPVERAAEPSSGAQEVRAYRAVELADRDRALEAVADDAVTVDDEDPRLAGQLPLPHPPVDAVAGQVVLVDLDVDEADRLGARSACAPPRRRRRSARRCGSGSTRAWRRRRRTATPASSESRTEWRSSAVSGGRRRGDPLRRASSPWSGCSRRVPARRSRPPSASALTSSTGSPGTRRRVAGPRPTASPLAGSVEVRDVDLR